MLFTSLRNLKKVDYLKIKIVATKIDASSLYYAKVSVIFFNCQTILKILMKPDTMGKSIYSYIQIIHLWKKIDIINKF